MKKLAHILLITLIALAGCAPEKDESDRPADVQMSIFSVHRGALVPRDSIDIQSPLLTEIVEVLEDGTYVEEGDLICTLAKGDRGTRLAMAEKDLEIALINVDKAAAISVVDTELLEQKIKQAELQLRKAREEYDQAFEQRQWQRIYEEKQGEQVFEFGKHLYERRLESLSKLEREGFSSRVKLLDAKLESDANKVEAAYNRQLLPWLNEFPDEQKLYAAKQNLKDASESLEHIKMSLDVELSAGEIVFKGLKDKVADRKEDVEDLQAQIASLTIYAPASGVILRREIFNGYEMEKLSPGDRVFQGMKFLSVIDRSQMAVEFKLDQQQYQLASPGKVIYFRPDAAPEYLISGKTVEASVLAAEARTADPYGEREFALKALLDEAPSTLMPGLNGTVYLVSSAQTPSLEELSSRKATALYTRKQMQRSVSLSGTVQAAKRSLINAPYSGKLAWVAEDGDLVKPGEAIARVDDSEIQKSFDDLTEQSRSRTEQLSLHDQKAEIDVAKASRKVEISQSAYEVAVLEHQLLVERRDEDKIYELSRQQELLDSRLQLLNEAAELEEDLFKRGLKSELDVLNAQLAAIRQKKDAEVNRYKLKLERSGPTKRQVRLSQIKVDSAAVELRIARLELKRTQTELDYDRQLLTAEIDKLNQQKNLEASKLESAEIKAGREGIVILPEIYTGASVNRIKVGDDLNEWIPFMNIADLTSLEVQIAMSEMDVKFISVGDEVQISLQAAQGMSFPGWVKEIGMIADNDVAKRQDATLLVMVALTNPAKGVVKIDPAFRPGSSCEVKIQLYSHEKVHVLRFDSVVPTPMGAKLSGAQSGSEPLKLMFSDGLNGFVVDAEHTAKLRSMAKEY